MHKAPAKVINYVPACLYFEQVRHLLGVMAGGNLYNAD